MHYNRDNSLPAMFYFQVWIYRPPAPLTGFSKGFWASQILISDIDPIYCANMCDLYTRSVLDLNKIVENWIVGQTCHELLFRVTRHLINNDILFSEYILQFYTLIPASCFWLIFWRCGFDIRPGNQLSWLRFYVAFLSPSRLMPG
jgi:hypothetical protein